MMDRPIQGGLYQGPPRKLPRGDYRVGWVSALPLELRAALACLDERHSQLPRQPDDHNTYAFGRIHHHNVVLACLPSGGYGTNAAANVAAHMRRSFPKIQMLLLVGIAGGVPFSADVRLGDVVVGQRIVQHDLGKELDGGDFLHTGTTHHLHNSLGTTLSLLRASIEPGFITQLTKDKQGTSSELCRLLDRGTLFDGLYKEEYIHKDDTKSCDSCDRNYLVTRKNRREGSEPIVHYGTIASGNQVVKDVKLRDYLGKAHGALCIEMEAAGLDHDFPSLVVRGICDYADSHKNKEWQDYAAATAAAFSRQFLLYSAAEDTLDAEDEITSPESSFPKPQSAHQETLMKSLSFEQIDARYEDISEPHDSTCEWITKHSTYLEWIDPRLHYAHHGFLWVRGKAGVGKSTIMKYTFETAREAARSNEIVLAFFFHARGGQLEKSALGLYRSILFQLLKEKPNLQNVLNACDNSSWTVHKLRRLLSRAVSQLGMVSLTIFIDALDECEEAEGLAMVRRFQREARDAFANGVTLRICFSSRPYPVVDMRKGLLLVLEEEEGHDRDLREYVRYELESWPEQLQENLGSKVVARARGIFLWATLVLNLLAQDLRRGRIEASRLEQRLEKLPARLSDLFREIINQDQVETDELRLSVQWALYSYVPLRPIVYYRVMMVGLAPEVESTYASLDPALVDKEMLERFVRSTSRGLLEVTDADGGIVQFIHESAREFFLKDGGMDALFPLEIHDEAACHERLKIICRRYLDHSPCGYQSYWSKEYVIDDERVPGKGGVVWRPRGGQDSSGDFRLLHEGGSFHRYALDGILWHAEIASKVFSQVKFLSSVDFTLWRDYRGSELPKYTKFTSRQFIMAREKRPLLLGQLIEHEGMVDQTEHAWLSYGNVTKHMTALQVAVEVDSSGCVAVLLEQGCDPNVHSDSRKSETLLHKAVETRSTELIKLLLRHGAHAHVHDRWGRTPLDRALIRCKWEEALVLRSTETNGQGEPFSQSKDSSFSSTNDFWGLLFFEYGPATNSDLKESVTYQCDEEQRWRIGYVSLLEIILRSPLCTVELLEVLIKRGVTITVHCGPTAKGLCILCEAVRHCDSEIVKRLLRTGIKPSLDQNVLQRVVDRLILSAQHLDEHDALTALGIYYRKEHQQISAIMDLLLRAGAQLTREIFISVCQANCAALTELLLREHGAENYIDHGDSGHLVAAAGALDFTTLSLLLDHGANVNVPDKTHKYAIHAACEASPRHHSTKDESTCRIVSLLLSRGADLTLQSQQLSEGPASPLQMACLAGKFKTVGLLLEHGAVINTSADQCHGSALQAACCTDLDSQADGSRIDLVRLLIRHGADVDSTSNKFGTSLQSCCESMSWVEGELIEIATLLLEAGADVNLYVDESPSYSALQAACLRGYPRLVHLLLRQGADVTTVGGPYRTALGAACSWFDTFLPNRPVEIQPNDDSACEIMCLLLSAGADVNAEDGRGYVNLEAICVSDYAPNTKFDMVKILLENGMRVPVEKRARHAFCKIVELLSPNVIPLLLQHGLEASDLESNVSSSDEDDEGSGGAPLLSDDGSLGPDYA